MSKQSAEKAYNAGRMLPSVTWPDDATDEQKTPGPHHCPFPEGHEDREHWMRGLRDGLGEPRDYASIIKQLDDELKGADYAR